MNQDTTTFELVAFRGHEVVGTWNLPAGSYTLGSSPRADVALTDSAVERFVGVLEFQNGQLSILSTASHKKLKLNGSPIVGAELGPDDELQCGPFALRARLPSAASASAVTGRRRTPDETVLLRATSRKPTPAPRRAVNDPTVLLGGREETDDEGQDERAEAREMLGRTLGRDSREAGPFASRTPTRNSKPSEIPDATDDAVLMRANDFEPTVVRRERVPTNEALEVEQGSGEDRLHFRVFWGESLVQVVTFGPKDLKNGRPITACEDEPSDFPLHGFGLYEPFALARLGSSGYQVRIPSRCRAATHSPKGRQAVSSELVTLSQRKLLRISRGAMTLEVFISPAPAALPKVSFKGVPKAFLVIMALLFVGFSRFLALVPEDSAGPAKSPELKRLVQLLPPPVKEETKKKIEEVKEKMKEAKEKEKKKKELAKKEKEPPPEKSKPVAKAMKSLEKLTRSPAMKNVLDNINLKPSKRDAGLPMAGMLGSNKFAMAPGFPGLKGSGGGGGSELLKGMGGIGVGALGGRGIGRGSVGGTVARATPRTFAVSGSIDREAVARVVNSHLQEIRGCYERALLKNPGLAGKVVLEWVISTSGRVVSAKTKSSSLSNGAVEGCILTNLKSWAFPQAKGGNVIVSYPFLFNSVGY